MGIEKLENAARAAGFAMAADEPLDEKAALMQAAAETRHLVPTVADSAAERTQAFAEWVKGVVGSAGRRAPA